MSPKNKELLILQEIKRRRNEKGFSQQYLALKLGIDQSAYHKIEAGNSSIKLHHFFAILEILEIDFLNFLNNCFIASFNTEDVSSKFSEIDRLLSDIKNHTLFRGPNKESYSN
jgi:transcriptional regulator with XRE-family HTH domain